MKNLYSRLGIDRSASAGEVQAALETKPELSEYATILLHDEKRAVYDTAHSTLKMIGALRLRLGLDSGPSWFLKNYLEFAPTQKPTRASKNVAKRAEADTTPVARPTLHQPNSAASPPPAQSRRRAERSAKRWAKWLVAAAIVIIAVIVLSVLLW